MAPSIPVVSRYNTAQAGFAKSDFIVTFWFIISRISIPVMISDQLNEEHLIFI